MFAKKKKYAIIYQSNLRSMPESVITPWEWESSGANAMNDAAWNGAAWSVRGKVSETATGNVRKPLWHMENGEKLETETWTPAPSDGSWNQDHAWMPSVPVIPPEQIVKGILTNPLMQLFQTLSRKPAANTEVYGHFVEAMHAVRKAAQKL